MGNCNGKSVEEKRKKASKKLTKEEMDELETKTYCNLTVFSWIQICETSFAKSSVIESFSTYPRSER